MRPTPSPTALCCCLLLAAGAGTAGAQALASRDTLPRVSIPTGPGIPSAFSSAPAPSSRPAPPPAARPAAPSSARSLYPWKLGIGTTVFWIGETPTENNPTPNNKSSWDTEWQSNFGGVDDPDPARRIANHTTGDFRPAAFTPKLNPFYIALPYNDRLTYNRHKPEAPRVIPWFSRARPAPGQSVCHGRWIQIHLNGRDCYAQWEDCGPWLTDDWEYVFGNKPPRNTANGAAGLDISPAVRDYLRIKSGQKVHWRFVEADQVPYGPWKRYGQSATQVPAGPDIEAQRRYLDYLRQLRDEQFKKRSQWELQQ